jgi:hypothetical protein
MSLNQDLHLAGCKKYASHPATAQNNLFSLARGVPSAQARRRA